MKLKSETIAQEALRLLSPIPEKRWCTGQYIIPETKQCCALGQYYRMKKANGQYSFSNRNVDGSDEETELRMASTKFVRDKYNKYWDIADVNNYPEFNNYTQKSIKSRVIALLKDMVKAGL